MCVLGAMSMCVLGGMHERVFVFVVVDEVVDAIAICCCD